LYIAKEKKKEEKRIYSDAVEAGVAREGDSLWELAS